MKKVVLLSSALILALSACSDKKSDSASNNTSVSNPPASLYLCEGGDVVNGYTLPPCPDPVENDKTLLGIDTNSNGVRDDVERWIVVRYKDHHKIVTEIGLQEARAAQIIIQDPSKAKETTKLEEAAQDCNAYFAVYANIINNEPILIDHSIGSSMGFKSIQYNTEQRIRAYLTYDRMLSGGVYTLPNGPYKRFCDFDVDKLLDKKD